MLFEAEETVRQAEEAELENERLVQDMKADNEKAKAFLDDPEEMIRLLNLLDVLTDSGCGYLRASLRSFAYKLFGFTF